MKKLFIINLILAMFSVSGFAAEAEADPGADDCFGPRIEGSELPSGQIVDEEAKGSQTSGN